MSFNLWDLYKTRQLQLQNFAEGMYFVKVSYADGISLTKKVIKQ
jgi:hypothetical protein